jgi:hypothetical protein
VVSEDPLKLYLRRLVWVWSCFCLVVYESLTILPGFLNIEEILGKRVVGRFDLDQGIIPNFSIYFYCRFGRVYIDVEKEGDFEERKVRYSDLDEFCKNLLPRESQWGEDTIFFQTFRY